MYPQVAMKHKKSKSWLLHKHVCVYTVATERTYVCSVCTVWLYVCSVCTEQIVLLVPLILFVIVNVLVDTSAQIKVTKGPERGQIELSKLLLQHFDLTTGQRGLLRTIPT